MATFQVWRNGGVENYDDYYDIPPDYDNIMRAEFDFIEPGDDGHSEYEHAIFASYNAKVDELMIGERTRKFWPDEIDKLTNLSLYNTDEQMSTAIISMIDTVDLNRGAYIRGGVYDGG